MLDQMGGGAGLSLLEPQNREGAGVSRGGAAHSPVRASVRVPPGSPGTGHPIVHLALAQRALKTSPGALPWALGPHRTLPWGRDGQVWPPASGTSYLPSSPSHSHTGAPFLLLLDTHSGALLVAGLHPVPECQLPAHSPSCQAWTHRFLSWGWTCQDPASLPLTMTVAYIWGSRLRTGPR